MPRRNALWKRWTPIALVAALSSSCRLSESEATAARYTDVATLVKTGLVYRDPRSTEPFSGPVYSTFPSNPRELRMRGNLVDGLLDGSVELFTPSGTQAWLDSRYEQGRECGTWKLNPFAVLIQDSLFWRAEVESRVPIPFTVRRALTIPPSSRSEELQGEVIAYFGGSGADSALAWSEGSEQVTGTIEYRTDNPECFDAIQNLGRRVWTEDPYRIHQPQQP